MKVWFETEQENGGVIYSPMVSSLMFSRMKKWYPNKLIKGGHKRKRVRPVPLKTIDLSKAKASEKDIKTGYIL